ncbi:uncharacterized protein LOC106533556 [Austrofundulus limnaeus]|uniref:Uncharacterized protein LOC106533556 n=1 Tax=Austrofundulus limnaeus TaxID=52670 RepID=A0A2I4CZF5_AUSLI|nr:PREDICTED: uncharacterized protein LOC106533556 [Austrofundulus limnaeus]
MLAEEEKSLFRAAMPCNPKTRIGFIFLVVGVYFYPFQPCCSVSLGQRKDGSVTYRGGTESSTGWERTEREHRQLGRVVKEVTWSPKLHKANEPDSFEPRTDSSSNGYPLTQTSSPKLGQTGTNFTLGTSTWTTGEVRPEGKSSSDPDSEDGYQADFAGFFDKQGKIWGLSDDSSPYFSDWEAMQPLVECNDDVMTLTVSGHGYTHLQVDRKRSSPISIFQLPSSCGYSVKASWQNLEMMVPYDGCYIYKENGSYVLPLLWLGSPVKLSCTRKMSTASPLFSLAAPSVLCSSYGMAVQIHRKKNNLPVLSVIMDGARGPFVSQMCAFQVNSQPQEFTFLISHKAPCITTDDGLKLQLLLDDYQYVLSCPVISQFSTLPSQPEFSVLSPGDLRSSYSPDTIRPKSTSHFVHSPKTSDQKQTAHYENYSPDFYTDFQYHQLPQVNHPSPQSPRPPQLGSDHFPGSQMSEEYPAGSGKLSRSFDGHLRYPLSQYHFPVKDRSQVFKSPGHLPKYRYLYYPNLPFSYMSSTPKAEESPKPPAGSYYPKYYLPSYHLATTAEPVTQSPVTVPPPFLPPKQTESHPHQTSPQYPPLSYHHHKPDFYSSLHPYDSLPLSPTVGTTDQPKRPSRPFNLQSHLYFQLPTHVAPTRENIQKPRTPQGYNSYSYQPNRHIPHLSLPLYPKIQPHPSLTYDPKIQPHPSLTYDPKIQPHPSPSLFPNKLFLPLYPINLPYPSLPHEPKIQPLPSLPPEPKIQPLPSSIPEPKSLPHPSLSHEPKVQPSTETPYTTSIFPYTTSIFPDFPLPKTPHLQCLKDKMAVFLPFANPESLQVRDHTKTWQFVSTVSPLCGYMLQRIADRGLILHSPLPACHSNLQPPTTISFPIKYWDFSVWQNRNLDLLCPYQSSHETQRIPETPAPIEPSKSAIPRSSSIAQIATKAEVFCSSHQMKIVLPAGPVSEIVLKDIEGKKMNLDEAPKHCGYYASNDKDGKILLTLHLQSHCHMSMQNERFVISVIYMTEDGRKETQISCPVVTPRSKHECNLQPEYRLPCGSSSISQTECLSMGCCFNKHPPACYYPMDECTIDRHMIFSVPSSLTDPPLSPARLVAASNSTCIPQRATAEYALFKIPMDGCGTRRVVLGKTVVYMVEVTNMVQKVRLNYGTITRDSPVRLLVECRYVPGTVLSVGYVVKTPTFGPEIHTQGVFGVQLRIAKDAEYSSYYPQYHQPLHMLLGKPLHLEVRLLNSPDPSLVLLVHFCVAYPRSGKAVWVLLYNGCPNPLDPAPPETVFSDPTPSSPQSQTRRFNIRTFQFLPDGDFQDINEEIYFMCSTEICSPLDGPCVEGCFGQ